jgi:hypothetical protein
MNALEGRYDEALRSFDAAIALAEGSDPYNAAWLTANCASTLISFAPNQVKSAIGRYRTRMNELGYPEMTRRYDELSQR